MKTEFTSSPWYVTLDNEWIMHDENTGAAVVVANIFHVSEANANLISAAPEMYEMLNLMAEYAERGSKDGYDLFLTDEEMDTIRKTLRKARGE